MGEFIHKIRLLATSVHMTNLSFQDTIQLAEQYCAFQRVKSLDNGYAVLLGRSAFLAGTGVFKGLVQVNTTLA
jgi:hypothetical protein